MLNDISKDSEERMKNVCKALKQRSTEFAPVAPIPVFLMLF